jgi:hypothetical protein
LPGLLLLTKNVIGFCPLCFGNAPCIGEHAVSTPIAVQASTDNRIAVRMIGLLLLFRVML